MKNTEVPNGVNVPEGEAESAAKKAVCDGLEAYSSKQAESLNDLLRRSADTQQLGGSSLSGLDPSFASRAGNAADSIETSQKASDVASKLGCSE